MTGEAVVSPDQDSILVTAVGMLAVSVSDQGAVRKLSLNVPSSPLRQVTDEVRTPGRNVINPQAAAAIPTAATRRAGLHWRWNTRSPMATDPIITPAMTAAWT